MARLRGRREVKCDIEIRLDDGRVITVEVKDVGRGINVRDLATQAAMHISGASAAAVGAASVFGWYVRSNAPWAGGDDAAVFSDWVAVGDDLWRATGEITRSGEGDGQHRLFDPREYAKAER